MYFILNLLLEKDLFQSTAKSNGRKLQLPELSPTGQNDQESLEKFLYKNRREIAIYFPIPWFTLWYYLGMIGRKKEYEAKYNF